MQAIVVPDDLIAGATFFLTYHDRPGSVARVRFIGPTMQATSVHLDAKCKPPCKTKAQLSLAMSGNYIIEAMRMYELSSNETESCDPDWARLCYKKCNPQSPQGGFDELVRACNGTHSWLLAACQRPIKNYFACMRSCADQCNFPTLLGSSLPILSPTGEVRTMVKVRGSDFLGPATSMPCSSESALGPGVWTHIGVCFRWAALQFDSYSHCEASLRGEHDERRLFPELINMSADAPARYIWRPLSCCLSFTRVSRYTSVTFLGVSTTAELQQELVKIMQLSVAGPRIATRLAFPRMYSSFSRHLSELFRTTPAQRKASKLLVFANCGRLHPTTITRGSSANRDEEDSCRSAAAAMAHFQNTSRLDLVFQAHPSGMPYHYDAAADALKPQHLRYKFHGDRGWFGVEHKVDALNDVIIKTLAAAGCRASVFDEHAMAQPWWDLQGDGLHWRDWMPDDSRFFVANVVRVLLHYITASRFDTMA